MSRRSRLSRRAGLQDKGRVGGTDRAAQDKNRRWSAVMVLAIAAGGLLLMVVALGSVLVYRIMTAGATGKKPDEPRRQEVEEFIHRYFSTWSSHDMKGYGECFLSNASIQFIDARGEIQQDNLPRFLKAQAEALRKGESEKEEPESIDVRFEAELARAVVYWKLTAGPMTVYGYDHFTLARHDGQWGIVNLVFYETKHSD